MREPADASSSRQRSAFILCVVLIFIFCVLAILSFRTESATVDEPLHGVAAYEQVFAHDFRFDPEQPALWKHWMMLPHRAGELGDISALTPPDPWTGVSRLLFQTPRIDGAEFIEKSRWMMLIVGVLLCIAIASWSWQLAGPTAAVAACALFAFDPNHIAHAPLLKNDVSLSLSILWFAWALWTAGKELVWWNLLLLGLACGIAATVKFSGILVMPLLGAMLTIRVMMPFPWRVFGRDVQTRLGRVVVAIFAHSLAALITWIVIWASYDFRYFPTARGDFLDLNQSQSNQYSILAGGVAFAGQWHLFPQAWLFGLQFIYNSMLARQGFLLGQTSMTGWWYYFPLAMLFKTPIAILLAIFAAVIACFKIKLRESESAFGDWWTRACLVLPPLIYGFCAMAGHLNLGLRHILPVYPFIFIAIAIVAACIHRERPTLFRTFAIVIGVILIAETTAAFPHYISFFNIAARPFRLQLLSDSNFDWGQDLPYVQSWQQDHPDQNLYLGYWGPVDPSYYGIHFSNLPGGFVLGHENDPPIDWSKPGVIMVSATLLQGVNVPSETREYYAPLRARKPDQIIGDTIYLYNWPFK